ncbi:BrnT family toxin [Jannaschia formosa]|uniref:BrnT family toxin n=1 Tax=Jannaschia formosa TaxID=2259592 RepID=UPI000E1C35C6|nr:BrnT family toxin [Jannaschia formosa]TFL19218.1 BrnT family toxin [Jannaschia formosa]
MPRPPYDWDDDKAKANLDKHGVPFEAIFGFDWDGALRAEDTRYDYGETRFQALGKIGDRAHVVVYVLREETIRVISLRKANRREQR